MLDLPSFLCIILLYEFTFLQILYMYTVFGWFIIDLNVIDFAQQSTSIASGSRLTNQITVPRTSQYPCYNVSLFLFDRNIFWHEISDQSFYIDNESHILAYSVSDLERDIPVTPFGLTTRKFQDFIYLDCAVL